ncbi:MULTISPECIES: M3 family metallopeptidase [Pseudomonas]|uniref:M3 family metallopeptidase n=1 Tax=Pseudomonas TaxID=286 RepID=UPI001BE50688|nr:MULTISPECIES: M3 family metallopeptidase [Pseudomonas]MBT2341937.1 oligopeptidase A [Pseudomonas fluorescens]MCD4532078.1 M3 family metallopeptidase [Pseudomonas sp. C3-2018]
MPDADNPLLQAYDLPPFPQIKARHFSPALDRILAESRDQVTAIIKTQTPFPTWDDLVLAMDEVHTRLEGFGYLLHLLTTTRSGDAWAQASLDCSERLHDFQASLKQHPTLFTLYQRLADSPIAEHFAPVRRRTLKKILREFHQNGATQGLSADLSLLKLRIQEVQGLFLENLRMANQAWRKVFDDEARLSGLPARFKQQMARQARAAGRSGWLLTLSEEAFGIVTQCADDRLLRQQMYEAYSTRASDKGPHAGQFDNGDLLRQLLDDRHQYATSLGYADFAQLAIEPEQAASTGEVLAFLQTQLDRQRGVFKRDTDQLKAFAAQQGFSELQPWDYPYLANQLRQQAAGASREALSVWFELESTFSQLLQMATELFGVSFVERPDPATWHPDVRLFEVREWGAVIGYIYFDPFADANRDGYPHTTTLRNRHITAEGRPRHPVATLHAWLPRSAGPDPVLLDHLQLRVLFHEFGHCLQHVLTHAEYRDVSGISGLSRDTAEFAGVLFEQWCFSRQCLVRVSRHYQTGETMPDKVAAQLLTFAKTQASWESAVLLRNALFDLELHRTRGDGRSVQQVFDQASEQVGHLPVAGNERWPNGLDYLVTGYDARIYAYLWSRALAIRVFQRFRRDGLFNPATGRALRDSVFAPGDGRPLAESIAAFSGTPPISALAGQPSDPGEWP